MDKPIAPEQPTMRSSERRVCLAQEIVVFHAVSLSQTFQQMALSFENQNPGIKVNLEGSGARLAARKVMEN